MNTKLFILFYVKRAKTTIDGLVTIYIRINVDGERIELSTKRFTNSDKWSAKGSCMKGYSVEAKSIISFLESLKA